MSRTLYSTLPVLFLLILPSHAQDQQNIVVELDERLRYGAAHEETSWVLLRPLSVMKDSLRRRVTLPDSSDCPEPAYGDLFFTGSGPDAALQNSIRVLVCDHDSRSPDFYVDRNNNLDFTDDGAPQEFDEGHPEVNFRLENAQNPAATVVTQWSRFSPEEKQKFDGLVDKLEKKTKRQKQVVGYYKQDFYNIVAGDLVFESDSIRVGLKDRDQDGLYNEVGEDQLLIGEYGSDALPIMPANGARTLQSTTYFQGQDRAFKVTSASKAGDHLTIAPALKEHTPDQLQEGEKAPNVSVRVLGKTMTRQKNLSSFIGQSSYLYLNFWATWCTGCRKEISTLRALHKNPKVTVLSLNYNEDLTAAASFIDENDIEWTNGFSNSAINDTFRVHGLPRGVLIDQEGTITDLTLSADDALERVTQKTSPN